MRKYVLMLITLSALGFGGAALAQTTAPEATVPPVPTPEVEATAPPTEAPPVVTEQPPTQAPVVPGTTTDDGADDDGDGLSSNTILFLILGGVVLVLIAFGVAMSQRRPGDPDPRV